MSFNMRDAVTRAARGCLPWLLSVVVTLAMLCLCLEGGARLLLPGDTIIWPMRFDPKVGLIFAPHATVRNSNGLDFDVTETTNAAGFIDRELPAVEKSPGTCRVAFIGDSFVTGSHVKIEHKVQVVFERLAKQHWPELVVEAMGFAHDGTGQVNQLAYYDQMAQPLRPDAVVLVVVNNDLNDNSSLVSALRQGFHPHHAPLIFAREVDKKIEIQPIDPNWRAHVLPRPILREPWWHRELHAYSRFYRGLFLKLSLLYPSTMRDLGWLPDAQKLHADRMRHLMAGDPELAKVLADVDRADLSDAYAVISELREMFTEGADLPAIYAQAVRFTGFGFDEFKRRARRDGFELVALSVVGTGTRLDARLRTMIEPKGIPYLSQESFVAGLGEPIDKAHWAHDSHWNRQGHAWAAEQVFDHFARTGLCGRPPKPLR